MTSHELARQLLENPDCEVIASIDISTCDEDSCRRLFSEELVDLAYNYDDDKLFVSICFVGV